jgi:hypothetical protein
VTAARRRWLLLTRAIAVNAVLLSGWLLVSLVIVPRVIKRATISTGELRGIGHDAGVGWTVLIWCRAFGVPSRTRVNRPSERIRPP